MLLWHAIFPLLLTVGHASLACHISSLPHCGSCFFGMPSFLFLFFSIAISFCMNVWERWIIFKSIDVVKMKDEWMVWKWTMNMCTWSRSWEHEKQLKVVTKFDKAQLKTSSMCKWLSNLVYMHMTWVSISCHWRTFYFSILLNKSSGRKVFLRTSL